MYTHTHICTLHLLLTNLLCLSPETELSISNFSHDRPRSSGLYYLNLIITLQKHKCKENSIAYIKLTLKITHTKSTYPGIWNILLIYILKKSDVSLFSPVHAFFYFFLNSKICYECFMHISSDTLTVVSINKVHFPSSLPVPLTLFGMPMRNFCLQK